MTPNKTLSPLLLFALTSFAMGTTSGCGKEDEEQKGNGKVGSQCAIDAENSCNNGLECTAAGDAHRCTFVAGSNCDPGDDLENNGCGPGATCEVPNQTKAGTSEEAISEDIQAVCLLTKGELCDPNDAHCGNDLTCAPTTTGETRCFGRVVLRGTVSDTSDASTIEGALLIALDEEGGAVTDVFSSDADGRYLLDLPIERNEDGSPIDGTFTLNGAAQDYQPFPNGVRVALPIEVSEATEEGSLWVVDNALTDVGLIPLPPGDRVTASGSISGLSTESPIGGLLVVATGDAGAFTALTDRSGEFTVFNLPDGEYEVQVYGAGVQIEPTAISVSGQDVKNLSLSERDEGTAKVTGQIQIVNAPGGALTSVILVVEDTFNETAARGEVPRGLRAPASGPVSVDGDFTIEGVPDGDYVVLAAYENDSLVRDPDTNIAGTGFVRVSVSGSADVAIEESFKVTEALATESPGAESSEAVEGKPMLVWADDSSEDWYDVYVYDAFGDEVWNSLMVPGVSGSETVSVQYEGPLDPGMYYQFRVSAWRQPGMGEPSPTSTTEDLKGVFYSSASE